MRRSSQVLAIMAMILAVGSVIYLAREIDRERNLLTSEQTRMARLERQLAELRQQRDEALHELDLATQNLAAAIASAAPAGTVTNSARATVVESWHARVKRLKQTFDEHPEQRIPEFALLSDLDWLALARPVRLDSEEDLRKARAKTRDAAFSKFQTALGQALHDYATAANGVPLLDLSQLMPYFNPAIDPAILQRYEIAGPASPSALRDSKTITERSPVDEEFDIRHAVSLDGHGGGSTPWAVDSLSRAALDALRDFTAANNGQQPKNDADILPFVHDPTAKMIFEAMTAYGNDHRGQQPSDATALRPYVNDPAARVLLEKLINAKKNEDGR